MQETLRGGEVSFARLLAERLEDFKTVLSERVRSVGRSDLQAVRLSQRGASGAAAGVPGGVGGVGGERADRRLQRRSVPAREAGGLPPLGGGRGDPAVRAEQGRAALPNQGGDDHLLPSASLPEKRRVGSLGPVLCKTLPPSPSLLPSSPGWTARRRRRSGRTLPKRRRRRRSGRGGNCERVALKETFAQIVFLIQKEGNREQSPFFSSNVPYYGPRDGGGGDA